LRVWPLVEQVVDLDADRPSTIENSPWVYAARVQTWTFTEPEAERLREYLHKGELRAAVPARFFHVRE
jgi:hypothetical protein